MFRKRDRRGGAPAEVLAGSSASHVHAQPEFFHIGFEMMVKGSIIERRSGPVRQFGVTVNGSTRLVTSGDTVDRRTYDALLVAGAIRPKTPPKPSRPASTPPPLPLAADQDAEE